MNGTLRAGVLLAVLLATGSPLAADDVFTGTPAACLPDDPAYARVPAGEFFWGSSALERARALEITAESGAALEARWFAHEHPFGPAETGSYEIAKRPVTQAEFMAFVRWTGHRAPAMDQESWEEQGYLVHGFDEVAPYVWRGTRHPDGLADHPVVLVSRSDAEAYAAWLSARTGCEFRLPTSTEWERAARGEDGRAFPWGDEWDPGLLNSGYRLGGTSPVGAHADGASPYGLFDTAGNVFEWTSTSTDAGEAVLKGCSWDDLPGFCRPAYWHTRPGETRHVLIGFRLVRRVPPPVAEDGLGEPLDP